MAQINPSPVLECLSSAEITQLEAFRGLVDEFAEIEEARIAAPPDHDGRWQAIREKKKGEIKEIAQTSEDLKLLFMGVLAVEEVGGEEHLKKIRDSHERLTKFETDQAWLDKEAARIAAMERAAPVKDLLVKDAHWFMGFVDKARLNPEENKLHHAVIDPEGIIVDDEMLLWEKGYDPSRRIRYPISKEVVVARCYHAAGLLLSAERFRTYSGTPIVVNAKICRQVVDDDELRGIFTTEGARSPVTSQAGNRLSTSLHRVNNILRLNGKPALFRFIRSEQSKPYGSGYTVNDDYGISFSERAKEYGNE